MKKELKEKYSIEENVEFIIRDKNGKIKDKLVVKNQTTKVSLAVISARIAGIAADPFDYIAIGEGITPATADDTALESEITTGGGERVQVTPTQLTTTETNDTFQINKTVSFTAPFNVSEAGIFNAASGGVMMSRVVRAPSPMIATDNLEITWKIKVA
jgi:hypothetical protein